MCVTPFMSVHSAMTDRRAFLAAALASSVAIVTPAQAIICHPDPVSEFLAIENWLNAGGSSEEEYLASIDRLYEWRPDTAEGFTRKFVALMGNPEEDGWPPHDRMLILVQDARRLGERGQA